MVKKTNFLGYVLLLSAFASAIFNIDGYIIPNFHNKRSAKKNNLKLRNNNNNLVVCNEKYIYMNYLLGLRNFKKVYRIIKDTSNIDMQNIINILSNINITQIANITENYNYSEHYNNYTNSMFINNTGGDSNKIVKNLILSNIYIDVSNVKYIQISTRNDTLLVELDKNNVETSAKTSNNIMYDITKIEALVSSISLIMKVLNIN
jgi:hypothetical protein